MYWFEILMMNVIINDIDKKEMDGRIINYKKIY